MPFFKIRSVLYTILAFLLLLIFFPLSAKAQKQLEFSTTEDIALIFYKTGGIIPNFERWIKERAPYNLTSPARREEMMKKEKNRLQTTYRDFNPEKNLFLIRSTVRLSTEEHQDKEGNKTYSLQSTFTKAPDALYFPYNFLGTNIIVMPHKMDVLMKSAISKRQYDLINKTTNKNANNTMILRLRAYEADTTKPYEIDNIQQWVLITEIATLEIWNKDGIFLWQYSAPWYAAPEMESLNKLHSLKREKNHFTQ